MLNGGRESILQLKDELAGRVLRQVRAFEQRSMETIQNRSMILCTSTKETVDEKQIKATSTLSSLSTVNTPEEKLFEQALIRRSKGNPSSAMGGGTGEVTRSVKRLQNTPVRRWRERAREYERRHQLTPPHRFLIKKRR